MKRIHPLSAVCLYSLCLLAASSSVLAQDHKRVEVHGLINDYSPAGVKGGPWEMHGQWSASFNEGSDTADFAADMTMSDYGSTGGVTDATQGGQNAHTHHIHLSSRPVTLNMTGCPTFSPATLGGVQISGTVDLLTGNGVKAPFETDPPTSQLQVCITGGDKVPFSNMTMVFTGPATMHFGTQAIHGVVRKDVDSPF